MGETQSKTIEDETFNKKNDEDARTSTTTWQQSAEKQDVRTKIHEEETLTAENLEPSHTSIRINAEFTEMGSSSNGNPPNGDISSPIRPFRARKIDVKNPRGRKRIKRGDVTRDGYGTTGRPYKQPTKVVDTRATASLGREHRAKGGRDKNNDKDSYKHNDKGGLSRNASKDGVSGNASKEAFSRNQFDRSSQLRRSKRADKKGKKIEKIASRTEVTNGGRDAARNSANKVDASEKPWKETTAAGIAAAASKELNDSNTSRKTKEDSVRNSEYDPEYGNLI